MATTSVQSSRRDRQSPTVQTLDFRPDLQWLRAVAVLLVFAYHLDIPGFAGGYVGVDVFFVLSGYLITRLLVHEHDRTGTIDLPGFALRRVRRLLPVSTVVLLTTLCGMWLTMGSLRRAGESLVARATAVFGANVALAVQETDYLTAGGESALQHYWSLAVEEQFYLVWPALILVTVLAASRLRRARDRALPLVLVVLAIASLLLSARWTSTNQPLAFFLLPARAWQLIAGAVLAVTELTGARPRRRRLARWVGLVMLTVVTVGGTFVPFPWPLAILPVVGTAALVWAGVREGDDRPAWLEARGMVWIGDRSYALYLWHWPPLVLLGLTDLPWYERPLVRVLVVAGVFGATVGTYRLVEEPLRHGDLLRSRRTGFAFGAAAVALSFAFASAVTVPSPVNEATKDPVAPTSVASSGASGDPGPAGSDPTERDFFERPLDVPTSIPSDLTPSLTAAATEQPDIYANNCHAQFKMTEPLPTATCTYGDPAGHLTVALTGDSHAAQWFDAAQVAATEQGWRLLVLTKAGCSLYVVDVTLGGERPYPQCPQWRTATHDRLAAEDPDVVLVTGRATPAQRGDPEPWFTGAREGLERLRQHIPNASIVFLLDTPSPGDDIPPCLDERNIASCTFAPSPQFDARQRELARDLADASVDSPALLCDENGCPPVIGNVLIYRDTHHITRTASRLLAPALVEAVTGGSQDGA